MMDILPRLLKMMAEDERRTMLLHVIWATIFGLPFVLSPDPSALAPFVIPVILFPIVLNVLAMSVYYGNSPINWWMVWFGPEVVVDPTKHVEAAINGSSLWREIEAWQQNANCRRVYLMPSFNALPSYRYRFLRKRDAMMFKLAWG